MNPRISYYAVGANCNLKYLDGLASMGQNPSKETVYKALYDLFSAPKAFSKTRTELQFMSQSCGYLLFHRGSEHKTYAYGDRFMEVIHELGLGKVFKQEPGANGLHGGKEGILYVWIPDYKAISTFWHEYHHNNGVLGQTKKLVESIKAKMDF